MLGFGPLSSLPLSDSGVQSIRDVGGIASQEAFGVGAFSNAHGGGKYIRIRSVPAPVQYIYAESIVSTEQVSPINLWGIPAPCFEAVPIESAEYVENILFYLFPYIPFELDADVKQYPIMETWTSFAKTDSYSSVRVEVSSVMTLTASTLMTLSESPIIEMEASYA